MPARVSSQIAEALIVGTSPVATVSSQVVEVMLAGLNPVAIAFSQVVEAIVVDRNHQAIVSSAILEPLIVETVPVIERMRHGKHWKNGAQRPYRDIELGTDFMD